MRVSVAVIAITLVVVAMTVRSSAQTPGSRRFVVGEVLVKFRPGVNANMTDHLGYEYFFIAQSLVKGEGYSHPFGHRTGPTAEQARRHHRPRHGRELHSQISRAAPHDHRRGASRSRNYRGKSGH